MSECIAAFQRVNCAEILRIGVLFKFKSLMSSLCAIRTMLKYVTFISGQSFSLFLDASPPLTQDAIYICCICMYFVCLI